MNNQEYLQDFNLAKSDLQKLSEKISELKKIQQQIEEFEKTLHELKTIEQVLSREEIPQFLNQFGIDSIKLESGQQITIEEKIHVSLPKVDLSKRNIALSWISNNGGSDIIKDQLIIQNPEQKLIEELKKEDVNFSRKQEIHAQTLKAFFKDIIGIKKNSIQKVALSEIPKEVNLFVYKEIKIK